MKYFKKYRVRILLLLNIIIPFKNYSISYYFSRFGNNLQQIGIGILYSIRNKGNFYSNESEFIKEFNVISNPIIKYFSIFKKHYRFFYFLEKQDFPKRKLDEQYVKKNIQKIFKEEISPNIKFLNEKNIDEDTLVIHIRSGDIFTLPVKNYFQNPINFYIQIASKYKKVLVVTSEDMLNPVCEELKKINNIEFQSSSFENDFNTLYSAKNLATSGVGTFPIAAALLSTKLENFYYTDLYLPEHLNPEMVTHKEVKHHKYEVDKNYRKDYLQYEDIEKVILNYKSKVNKKNSQI